MEHSSDQKHGLPPRGKMAQKKKPVIAKLKKKQPLAAGFALQQRQEELELINAELTQLRIELEAAYRQYADLYDFAPVSYFTLTRDGTIRTINLAGANLLGAERAQIINQRLGLFILDESRPTFNTFLEKLLSGQGKETCELAFLKNENGIFWARLEATCFESGQESRAALVEITKLKQVEDDLRVSLIKYKTLFDCFPLGIMVSDDAGNILEMNPTATKFLGIPQEEQTQRVIGSPNWQIVRPDGTPMPPDEFACVRALKEKRIVENIEMGIIKSDAHTTWISLTALPLPLYGHGVVITYRDITERKQAEENLLKSEMKAQKTNTLLRSIMDSPQGIIIFALDTNFCYTAFTVTHKSTMKAIWNVEIEIGMNMLNAIGNPLDREKARKNFERALRGEQFLRTEEYGDPAKQRTCYEDRYSPIRDETGTISGVTVFVTDITKHKRSEAELHTRLQLSQFATSHSLDEVLQKTLDDAEILTNSQIGFIHFLEPDQKTLHLQMWSTNTLKNMCTAEGKGSHYPVSQAGVWADCVSKRAPQIHNDYPNLPASRRKGLPQGHAPILRELVVPVLRNNLIVMIMGVGNKPGNYDEYDVETLSQLANSAWDIVQRKRAEEALRESDELFSLFMQHSPIYSFIKSVTPTQSRVVQASENFAEMIQISSQDMIGKTMQELFPAEIAAKMSADDWNVVTNGKVLKLDEEFDGHNYTTIKFPIMQRNKTLLAGYSIDITERKQAEDELHRTKEILAAANHALQTALIHEQQLAQTDALTSIHNRRYLYELAEHEFEIAMRYQQPLSVIMFDIDHFKKVNDTFGHAMGDLILQRVAQIACAELRSADVIGRYGGEEFVAILPMTNAQQAYPLAERIREGTAALRVPTEKGEATVTLSIGIVEMTHGAQTESLDALIRAADATMYSAKQAGRNQTKIRD
jgi:diguanylate cyclase (GGDEF)-like protein/PAS domain S-box-containing protein